MVSKSSSAKRSEKPAPPYKGYPLWWHQSGQWCKKIKGKLRYFGSDPWQALEKYQRQRDDLQAGRVPRDELTGATIRDLCNHFLAAKRRAHQAGEINQRTFREYYQSCERIIAHFGGERTVSDIRPVDFGAFREKLAEGKGPVALGNEIQRVRVVFNFAFDAELVDRPVRFGQNFKKPPKRVIRQAKQQRPSRLFSAQEIRRLYHAAPTARMRAMILLGINCGLGNTDCAALPLSALDLEAGILDFPRPKTSIERRAVLWSETVHELRQAIDERPTPKDEAHEHLVFITRHGKPY
jgi:site-specific recombinase XerD